MKIGKHLPEVCAKEEMWMICKQILLTWNGWGKFTWEPGLHGSPVSCLPYLLQLIHIHYLAKVTLLAPKCETSAFLSLIYHYFIILKLRICNVWLWRKLMAVQAKTNKKISWGAWLSGSSLKENDQALPNVSLRESLQNQEEGFKNS